MNNKKLIGAIVVIIIIGVVACFLAYRNGVVSGMQSASVIKAATTAQISKGTTGTVDDYKVGKFTCWFYGGKWREYAGGHMDCDWALASSTVDSNK